MGGVNYSETLIKDVLLLEREKEKERGEKAHTHIRVERRRG